MQNLKVVKIDSDSLEFNNGVNKSKQRVGNENFSINTECNMKTRTSIYRMQFAYVLLLAIIFFGCRSEPQKHEARKHESLKEKHAMYDYGMKTIEHDSCEYVLFKDQNRSDVAMVHKQNCKYCAKRSKK